MKGNDYLVKLNVKDSGKTPTLHNYAVVRTVSKSGPKNPADVPSESPTPLANTMPISEFESAVKGARKRGHSLKVIQPLRHSIQSLLVLLKKDGWIRFPACAGGGNRITINVKNRSFSIRTPRPCRNGLPKRTWYLHFV